MKRVLSFIILCVVITLGVLSSHAQPLLTLPKASQKAMVYQEIGITKMKVTYHSPLVKGRDIWGRLVPYGQVWRAGANENTLIWFSTDVTVEGKALEAGLYGLHMLPGEDKWQVMFSNNTSSWGSVHYVEEENAMTVEVTPQAVEMQEWLSYSFENTTANSTNLVLRWEKLSVTVHIEVDLAETVFASINDEIRGLPGFFWQGPYQAANFCAQQNIHHEQAIKWIDSSIQRDKNFSNMRVKAQLLGQLGKNEESASLMKEAYEVATENELNGYGYQLMGEGDMKKALEVFEINVNRHPESWNVYDSLAEAQANEGREKEAIRNYETALEKAPADQQERIAGAIKRLKNK